MSRQFREGRLFKGIVILLKRLQLVCEHDNCFSKYTFLYLKNISHIFLYNYETAVFYVLQLSFSCFVIIYLSMSIYLEKTKLLRVMFIVVFLSCSVFFYYWNKYNV